MAKLRGVGTDGAATMMGCHTGVVTRLQTITPSAIGAPPPSDAKEVLRVVDYLEACNKLFERGLLAHVRIPTYPNQILENMEQGYSFLTGWLDSLLAKG